MIHPVFIDIETTGLNPCQQAYYNKHNLDAQVLCVGIGVFKDWTVSSYKKTNVEVFSDEDEYGLLDSLRENVKKHIVHNSVYVGSHNELREDKIVFVGWNNRKFDHAYLASRFARHRIDPGIFGYRSRRIDMGKMAYKMSGEYWKQDDWLSQKCSASLNEDSVDGGDIPVLYKNGKIGKIEHHCHTDIKDLMNIFHEYRHEALGLYMDHYGLDGGDIAVRPETRYL